MSVLKSFNCAARLKGSVTYSKRSEFGTTETTKFFKWLALVEEKTKCLADHANRDRMKRPECRAHRSMALVDLLDIAAYRRIRSGREYPLSALRVSRMSGLCFAIIE